MIHGMEQAIVNANSNISTPSTIELPVHLRTHTRMASCPQQYKDFFMLTEFTDDVGPVPLVCRVNYIEI